MEVNNKTLSVQKEQKEAAENHETAQEMGSAERNDLTGKLERLEQMYKNRTKLKNGKIISEWKWKKLSNLLKRKSVGNDSSPTPERESAKQIQPPEKWSTSRLRQNGRELVRNRIELAVKLKKARERNRIAKERLSQQDGLVDLSLVKREDERHQVDINVKTKENRRTRKKRQRQKTRETAEQRLLRLELMRSRRIANETKEERSKRLNRERRSRQLQREREKDVRATQDVQKDMGSSFDVGVQYFEIYECCPEELLDEKVFAETSTQSTTVTPASETQFDVVSNLLSSMYRKRQSDQPKRPNPMQLVDHLSTTATCDYILSTIRWHKLKSRVDGSF